MSNISIDKILKIINEVDPLGLYVDDETNKDEFISEAKEIEKKIAAIDSKLLTLEGVTKIVFDVFQRSFEGVEVKKEDMNKIANDLYGILIAG